MSTAPISPRLQDMIEEDPAFLQALLESYMERPSGLLSPRRRRGDGGGGGGDSNNNDNKRGETPPAAAEMIKNLAVIELREEDLLDPINHECCVCLEENNVGDKAVRLPHCSHIFHKDCIIDWLQRKCSCPVCRYEHPTEDADFEVERLQRQEQSKPRYARHELDRMTNSDLVALLPKDDSNSSKSIPQGPDLVNHLIESGAVDLINMPYPTTEYAMSTLLKMSVPQLRRVMNKEAGVFWHSRDIKTHAQLIEVFLASGRLHIVPEALEGPRTNADTKPSTTPSSSAKVLPKGKLHHREADKPKGRQLRKRIRLFLTSRN